MSKYHLKTRIPTAEEYLKVRAGAGMRVQNTEAAEKGAAPFYERYGFVRRGIGEPGMGKLIH